MNNKVYFRPLTLMSCVVPHSYIFIERVLLAVDALKTEHWFFSHGFDISNSIYFVNSKLNLDSIRCYDV